MNTLTNYFQKCLLMVTFLMPSLLLAQTTKACFKARVQTPDKKTMNVQLTSSDTIPLNNLGTIYALSIDATIEQPRESSFVRIVLEDTEGRNYLVAESDWFHNDTTTVKLDEYCEETAQLNGVTPLCLKCYLTHASLQLTGIHISNEMPTRGIATEQELRAMKEVQVLNIVDRINEYNIRHGKLWRAGGTDWALRSYNNQLSYEGEDAYISNFKYYIEGIYEVGESENSSPLRTESNYVESFDWRHRHGRNWMTPVKHQSTGNACWAFAAVGVTEALVNLYFNDTINYNLSEQEVISCSSCGSNQYGGYGGNALNWIANHGVSEEAAFPFSNSDEPCSNKGFFNEYISLDSVSFVNNFTTNNNDEVKKAIIKYGPLVSGYRYSDPNGNVYHGHAMTLAGYATVHAGDTIRYFGNYFQAPSNFNVISADDGRIGKTYWIFKNSYGTDRYFEHKGYGYILFNDQSCFLTPYYAKTPVSSLLLSDSDIKVRDEDGDGYYNWGIGTRPSSCPAWIPDEEDGDDSNHNKGPLNSYGREADISRENMDVVFIDDDTEITTDLPVLEHIIVRNITNNSTFTISHTLLCNHNATFRIEPSCSLVVDGGCIRNPNLDVAAGASVEIKNGGQILLYDDDTFNIPLGATLTINEGIIKKR
ncbi:MAG: hypothetical protein IKM77_06295 [Prevotella sp.]|nr:hypothetical protein [Prevotella sp.]